MGIQSYRWVVNVGRRSAVSQKRCHKGLGYINHYMKSYMSFRSEQKSMILNEFEQSKRKYNHR